MSSRRQLSGVGVAAAPAPAPGSSDYVSPLGYDGKGEYAMKISIGTPPQTFSAIADTGSDLVWLQCSGCQQCQPQSDALFLPANSSTYQHMSCGDPLCFPPDNSFCNTNNTCVVEYGYISGSVDIFNMSYDSVTLNTTAGPAITANHFGFGCGFNISSDIGGLDGLVGLGRGPLSFTTQLGSLFGHKFSYCLVSLYDSNKTTSPLLFGDAEVPISMYTPMVQNPNASYPVAHTYYYIGLTGIKINRVALDIPAGTFDVQSNGSGGVFLDSGTTLGYLTSAAYTPLLTSMMALVNYTVIPDSSLVLGFDLCYYLESNVSSPMFPVVTMVFEGFDLDLPQDNVFIGGAILGDSGYNSTYCMAFGDSGGQISIFGNIQQQNFQILYDREGGRYGFAPVKCDTL